MNKKSTEKKSPLALTRQVKSLGKTVDNLSLVVATAADAAYGVTIEGDLASHPVVRVIQSEIGYHKSVADDLRAQLNDERASYESAISNIESQTQQIVTAGLKMANEFSKKLQSSSAATTRRAIAVETYLLATEKGPLTDREQLILRSTMEAASIDG